MRPPPVGQLSVELEAATLRALAQAYDEFNQQLFHARLRRPVLALEDGGGRLGTWSPLPRTLSLARSLVIDQGWGVVQEVLKHEMAHQYVDEVLGRRDETAHGPVFRELCRARGIDGRASGVPSVSASGPEARALERVAKLLALAASPDEHEAHAAALAAQRLMLKYNVDLSAREGSRCYGFRHLGQPTGRVSECERLLASILAEHYFVEAIWVPVWRPLEGRRGSVLEVCGTPENLELAAYTHAFLLHTAASLWRARQRALGTRLNQGRRQFLAGVMAGFRDRLQQQQRTYRTEGLVWVGDAELDHYFRQRHPRVRWSRHQSSRHTEDFARGRAEGRQIVVHRGITTGPTAARPLALKGRDGR